MLLYLGVQVVSRIRYSINSRFVIHVIMSFSNFSCRFLNPKKISNLNYNCSIFWDLRNLPEQVEKTFCFQKLFWPLTVWINCSSDLKNFENSRPSASNFKSFSRSLEQFFLTVGQNNFGNKIRLLFITDHENHYWLPIDYFSGHLLNMISTTYHVKQFLLYTYNVRHFWGHLYQTIYLP